EPARLVRPDRHERDIERAIALANRAELRVKARIAGEEDAVAPRERESAPERVAKVADAATAEVKRRRRRDAQRCNRALLPPVELHHLTSTATLDERRETQGQNPHGLGVGSCQAPDGGGVEMVVVIVRLQHDIE